ncbi:MAG: hypothetical protein ACFWUC_04950 [Oscillospiraceae bacterium]|jgi:hypothetical protein
MRFEAGVAVPPKRIFLCDCFQKQNMENLARRKMWLLQKNLTYNIDLEYRKSRAEHLVCSMMRNMANIYKILTVLSSFGTCINN